MAGYTPAIPTVVLCASRGRLGAFHNCVEGVVSVLFITPPKRSFRLGLQIFNFSAESFCGGLRAR